MHYPKGCRLESYPTEASKIAGHKRQNELTRRVQEKPAMAGKTTEETPTEPSTASEAPTNLAEGIGEAGGPVRKLAT